MENVKIRIDLDAVEELAKALNVSADYLIDAELDCGGKECLYQVWLESEDRFKLYIRASSKRMAFLKFDKKFKKTFRQDFQREQRKIFQLNRKCKDRTRQKYCGVSGMAE